MPRRYRVLTYGTHVSGEDTAALRGVLTGAGCTVLDAERHSAGSCQIVSFDVHFAGSASALRSALAAFGGRAGADREGPALGVAVVPWGITSGAGPSLLVMDVDSTLIKQEVIELLAAHAGRQQEVAAVTDAAMRGELDFTQSLHARVEALAGLPASVIDDVGAAIELSDGADVLIQAFLDAGHQVAAVSGGFSQILDPLAGRLQLTHARANLLEIRNGRLTGKVDGPVVDRAQKERALREWSAGAGIPLERTIAVGDGANDLDMLRAAALGVAFNAKPAVRADADAAIDLPRLDIVRHFAGI